jgi:hypothetical protein
MNDTISVARIQATTPWVTLVWPWGIMASALVVNIAIFAAIGDRIPNGPVTGGLASLYLTAVFVAMAIILQHLPFFLGFGVTRRTFHRATTLVVTGWALASGVLLYLLTLVEHATDGWGVKMAFFDLPFLSDNPLVKIVEYAVPLLLMAYIGLAWGTVHLRWGSNGTWVLVLVSIFGTGAVAVLISWAGSWSELSNWLSRQPATTYLIGLPALFIAISATLTYLGLRRITI